MKMMAQCKLKRNDTYTTSWIPANHARLYKFLKLKKRDGGLEHGWQVVEVGVKREYSKVIEDSQDYKHQKSGSDI